MLLERLIMKKNKEINELKNSLFFRGERDKDDIVDNIKNAIEDLTIILEEENKLSNKERGRELTLSELAKYDGKEGRLAYIAVNGTVYDVTGIMGFEEGNHFGVKPGTDATGAFNNCHKGNTNVLKNLRVIGVLKQ